MQEQDRETKLHTAELMEAMQQEIRERGYRKSELSEARHLANLDEETGSDEALAVLETLQDLKTNPVAAPKTGNPVKRMIQSVIRKLTLFTVFPAFVHQNRFNAEAVKLLELQEREIEELKEKIRLLEATAGESEDAR